MRSDQLCSNCEWWDTRCLSSTGPNPCLRWPEAGLHTGGGQRCWQWAAKAIDPELGELDQVPDLGEAVALVREAGLSTGHAETCTDLVRELLREVDERRGVVRGCAKQVTELKARWDRVRQLLYQACLSGLNDPPEGWDEEARQLLREALLRVEG